MKQKLVVVNQNGENIAARIGISEDRRLEIQKEVRQLCKDGEGEGKEDNHAEVIVNIWNTYEDEKECAYALYIVNHTTEAVEMNPLFVVPETVASSL